MYSGRLDRRIHKLFEDNEFELASSFSARRRENRLKCLKTLYKKQKISQYSLKRILTVSNRGWDQLFFKLKLQFWEHLDKDEFVDVRTRHINSLENEIKRRIKRAEKNRSRKSKQKTRRKQSRKPPVQEAKTKTVSVQSVLKPTLKVKKKPDFKSSPIYVRRLNLKRFNQLALALREYGAGIATMSLDPEMDLEGAYDVLLMYALYVIQHSSRPREWPMINFDLFIPWTSIVQEEFVTESPLYKCYDEVASESLRIKGDLEHPLCVLIRDLGPMEDIP